MLKLLPLLLMILYGIAMMQFSAWRTARMLDARSRPLTDPAIGAVTARLATALDLPMIPVNVFDVPVVNGLAAPDGRIFLTQGFLDRHRAGAVTPEELGSVIAHELGHVALGHSRRRMIDFTGQNAVFVLLSAVLGRLIPGLGLLLARGLSTALMAGLSRRDEYEADEWAAALLIKAGIGTAPQKSLFRKLGALSAGAGSGAPAWLMSHPATDDRIAAIEQNEARWLRTGPAGRA